MQDNVSVPYGEVILGGRSYKIPRLPVFKPGIGLEGQWSALDAGIMEGEQALFHWIGRVMKGSCGAFVDVGANLGQSLLRLLAVAPESPYFGFEPNIQCCYYVEAIIHANKLSRHSVLPIALSNTQAVRQLLVQETASNVMGTASMIEGFRPPSFYTSKRAMFSLPGDLVLADPAFKDLPLAAIKVDVEGGELEVMEGLENTLLERRPALFFEILPHFLVATGQALDAETTAFRNGRLGKLDELFDRVGYSLFRIEADASLSPLARAVAPPTPDLSRTAHMALPTEIVDALATG